MAKVMTQQDSGIRPRRLITAQEADAAHQMLRVVSFAETVRVVPPSEESGVDLPTFRRAITGLARLGVAEHISRIAVSSTSAADIERFATAILSAIEECPLPQMEWDPLSDILADRLPELVGVSATSLARYRSGERSTPDPVAGRLHVLTHIVADLSGSYNDFGVRRWFGRPRQALQGRAPEVILTGRWSPDAPDVLAVRNLAASLLGSALG